MVPNVGLTIGPSWQQRAAQVPTTESKSQNQTVRIMRTDGVKQQRRLILIDSMIRFIPASQTNGWIYYLLR
jgi:hypothetical protein